MARNRLVRMLQTDEGRRPNVPDGTSFRLIAAPRAAPWGLYSCDLPDDNEPDGSALGSLPEVSAELDLLLDAAARYAPAMALAAHEAECNFGDEVPDPGSFTAYLSARLRHHLEKQKDAPYLLARARTTEVGYRDEGEYCWLLRCRQDPTGHWVALWVSSDFQLYEDRVDEFDVDEQTRRRLTTSGSEGERCPTSR